MPRRKSSKNDDMFLRVTGGPGKGRILGYSENIRTASNAEVELVVKVDLDGEVRYFNEAEFDEYQKSVTNPPPAQPDETKPDETKKASKKS